MGKDYKYVRTKLDTQGNKLFQVKKQDQKYIYRNQFCMCFPQ